MNLLFGVAAAWAIAKFEFRGKPLLITLIDLPFAISPVVSGLMWMILFGIALHGADNQGSGHWVSLPLTLSYDGEDTDFKIE